MEKHRSPDKAVIAVIKSSTRAGAARESRVELRSASGSVLAKEDYLSEDGEHGFGLTKAAWTPDSQFFVYSLESSGGHSPWHSPVQLFSRENNKIVSLDDQLKDAVTDPQFELRSPDIVVVGLWFSRRRVEVFAVDALEEPPRAMISSNTHALSA